MSVHVYIILSHLSTLHIFYILFYTNKYVTGQNVSDGKIYMYIYIVSKYGDSCTLQLVVERSRGVLQGHTPLAEVNNG